MVTYIKSDLEFILKQIQIAEANAAGQPLFGPGGLIPAYTLSFGLRTVDGTYNNLLPGQETWGSADQPFTELLTPEYRAADPSPFGPPGPATNYNPSNNPGSLVFDSSVRTISNLIVDQTLGNPAAILVALERAGIVPAEDRMAVTLTISDAYEGVESLFSAVTAAEVAFAAANQAAGANPGDPVLVQAQADAAAALSAAQTVLADGRGALDLLLTANGIQMDGANVLLTNIAPDEGLSAPFNSWFTLFGQFFDHGLDLVNKGGSGTVFIPLQPDDPLYVPGGHTNFMVLTRATVSAGADNVMGTADDVRPVNTTTPFVDQNQTYSSHSSHQVFLRQYVLGTDGRPHATGHLIEGGGAQPGGMATWGEVKAQAKTILGIELTDFDVGSIPLLRTDAYGNFIPGANGYPQVILGVGADGIPNTADDVVASGTALNPINPTTVSVTVGATTYVGAIRTDHAFLADIAHDAVPVGKVADGDITIGLANPGNGSTEYDNELLDAHFIAGDGRANENIGLTAVHHIFHSEHNRLADHTKVVVVNDAAAMLAGGATQAAAVAFLNEWLAVDVATVPVGQAAIDALVWDGNRLFQAAKFGTEMQYQHLVFEDFARKIQPAIDFFVVPDGYHADINPNIVAEFAHVVYRFGHSMLTETIDRLDPTFTNDQIGLIQAFLNPVEFDEGHTVADSVAAGNIIRGMTRQVGNEIDEFVTSALRNNLLGLPLDLATINLARGRDTGVPSLNAARREFFEASQNAPELKPYDSWVEFAGGLKNEASVINFIAAYGLHDLILDQTTVDGKRDAAMTIIFGQSFGGLEVPADATDFLNGTGAWANTAGGITTTGIDNIDLWIGGLAEKIMPFGGMLGSTFNFVFEVQLEKLQDGDRFYYLQRLDGLHLLSEMENNTFAKLISKNADAGHLPSDVFSTPGLILEVDQTKQWNPGLGSDDPLGSSILVPLVSRDNPATPGVDTNYLKYTGEEHVLLGGTNGNDILISGIGDDTLYGDAGNDRMEGGFGNDQFIGGDGDDIITDMGGDDIIRSGNGHDAINAGSGVDLIVGDAGQDFIVLGADMLDEAFGGVGNDFVLGSKTTEQTLGGEGDDWIEVGAWTGAVGDNFDDQFQADSVKGHDVFHGDGGFDEFVGEGGDDIWFGSLGRGKFDGLSGYDWTTYADMNFQVDVDLARQILPGVPVLPPNVALDTFTQVEGASGSRFADVIRGTDVTAADVPTEGFRGSALDAEGIALIGGLQQLLVGAGPASFDAQNRFVGGNILLGGDGSDLIEGRGGDDIIDGDRWLRVRIAVMSTFDANGPTGTTVLSYHDSMKTLVSEVMAGHINPGQLKIVRDITNVGADAVADIDTALYSDLRANYAFSARPDGTLVVTHTGGLATDGTDMLRNIERLQFSDGSAINVIIGTPFSDNGLAPQGAGPLNQPVLNGTSGDDLILGLAGADILNGNAGNDILVGGANGTSAVTTTSTYRDNFETSSLSNTNGTATWATSWVETGDNGNTNSASAGQIRIDNGTPANTLVFRDDDTDAGTGTATIQRAMNLSTATSATISYDYNEVSFDAGEIVTVTFAADGTNFTQTIQTINGNSGSGSTNVVLTGPFGASSAVRFVVSGTNANSGANPSDYVSIDNLVISYSTVNQVAGVDILNGGLGDDTYSFSLGDGNDTINEAVNANSGGTADRISIQAPTTGIDPLTDLPITTLTALNAFDSNNATTTGDLVISYTMPDGVNSVTQTITVAGHFTGNTAGTGVERINFNGAQLAGYQLGADDYLISRADPANRDSGGVNLSASLVNNFVVGEQGVNDVITGGGAKDLIFGGTGNNDLVGGLGDDLLVGGTGNDDLDARLNAAGDDFAGALGADTMIGGAGNDTYGVDDLLDVVVEAANEGTDEVQTFLAALSLETVNNVENLTYMGVDADQFVGTGNSLNNVITGGALADTLSGLAGNDSLDGGLGADTMTGGDGNDVYDVDEAGDVVIETNADALIGGVDRVESDVDYVLGANVENLDLNATALVGTGNALNNVINGNDENNQLFGGLGLDTLTGGDGDDLLDGGEGNDTLNGGNNNDTIIGGAGDDIIDVGGGFNTVVYNTTNFGNDTINSFDSAGGTPATQDRIDLRGLGVTAANFGNRVFEAASGGNTVITIRENGPASAIQGTITIVGSNNAAIDQSDFTLGAAAPAAFGAPTAGADTITGNAAANTINGLGGNDILSGAGGDDVVNGGEGADTLNGGDGNDTLTGGTGISAGTFSDNFDGAASYTDNNGTLAFNGGWTEGGGETTGANNGDIQINTANGSRLHFEQGIDGGEYVERAFNLTGATSASVQFSYVGDSTITGTENVTVQAWNHTTNSWQTLTGGVLSTASGAFNVNLTAAQIGPQSAIRFTANGAWDNGDDFFIDNFVINASGNLGVDTINGDAGDDTIVWNANAAAPTDGRDVVDGGTEGLVGDTFVVNGNAAEEWYRIYTRAEAILAGIVAAAATEIVITRAVAAAGPYVVIAELSEIEEIRLNGADPSGATGAAGGDHFEIIGNFSGTNLRLNTITIDGDAGDDTVDISALSSAHRIVFRSNGGHDTIVGTMRPQDVIELPPGMTMADFVETTDENGVTTLSDGEHSIRYVSHSGPPVIGGDDDEDEDDDDEGGQDDDDSCDTDDDDDDAPAPAQSSNLIGTPQDDILLGTSGGDLVFGFAGTDYIVTNAGVDVIRAGAGDDFVDSGSGRDIIFGDIGDDDLFGGDDDDLIYGEDGDDRIFGQDGNDLIDAGDDDDFVFGGSGNDQFVASLNDGNDTYYGGDISGDSGKDTLDMGFLTAGVAVDLGTGVGGRGSAVGSQSGTDTLWGVENVTTGSGNDTITMSNAVNVVDGGQGEDVFVFGSAAAAHGDTLRSFQAGDKIDLSGIDANTTTAGNGTFTLESGQSTSAPGQIVVTHETREDGEYTVISGDTTGSNAPEFRISIAGNHTLTVNDFNL